MFSAIVLSGGSGSRMGTDTPKQFLLINDKPLIYYALKAFDESQAAEVILVTREEDIDYMREEIVHKYDFKKVTKIVAGGETRYDSVFNGISAASDESDIVMIHDGARPFVTDKMIEESYAACREGNAVTVGMPVKDTIKVIDENSYSISTPARNTLVQVQTPQTFNKAELLEAYSIMYKSNDTDITDDTMIVERYLGKKVKVIQGSYTNIKVTTIEDIGVANVFATR